MKNFSHLVAVAITTAAMFSASAQAATPAKVTFVNTEKMSDVPRWKGEREAMEMHLQEHFDLLAAKLPAGQTLKVEILDIDLAGEVFPRVPVRDIRVMKGRADYPVIKMRYSIEQDGKVVSSGERRLTDTNYQQGLNRYSQEIYAYEKQMLDDWFKKEIVAAR